MRPDPQQVVCICLYGDWNLYVWPGTSGAHTFCLSRFPARWPGVARRGPACADSAPAATSGRGRRARHARRTKDKGEGKKRRAKLPVSRVRAVRAVRSAVRESGGEGHLLGVINYLLPHRHPFARQGRAGPSPLRGANLQLAIHNSRVYVSPSLSGPRPAHSGLTLYA